MKRYTVDYFIKKFSAIPENMWIVGSFGSPGRPRCALGHCLDNTKEVESLQNLMKNFACYATSINDNKDSKYQQSTPKQRILAALYDIKTMQQSKAEKAKETTNYVVVEIDSKIKENRDELIFSN